jgi:hypothetical protein
MVLIDLEDEADPTKPCCNHQYLAPVSLSLSLSRATFWGGHEQALKEGRGPNNRPSSPAFTTKPRPHQAGHTRIDQISR